MDFNQFGTVIFAFGTTGWIPIWALFEGIAKCIRALKGTDVAMEEFRSTKKTEDLEENNETETEEVNNTVEQKTRRTKTKTEKDSSEQK